MKFIVNTTPTKQGGGLQVSASMLSELRRFEEHSFHVLLGPQLDRLVDRGQYDSRFSFAVIPGNPTSPLLDGWRARRWLRAEEARVAPDGVLTVFGPAMWRPRAPHVAGFANVQYLYVDSRFIRERKLKDPWTAAWFRLRRRMMLFQVEREADRFWVETGVARSTLASTLGVSPSLISVATNTSGAQFEGRAAGLPDDPIDGPFRFVYLANNYDHKNFPLIRDCIPLLRERGLDVEFLLSLTPAEVDEIFGSDPVVRSSVKALGQVAPADCPDVYRRAHATFAPTLLEIFTATYPESMAMDRPVLTSDLPFARSVCQDAAEYFDPFDPVAATEAIAKFIGSRARRLELIEAGRKRLAEFDTPAERAEKLVCVLEQLASDVSTVPRARPADVAGSGD